MLEKTPLRGLARKTEGTWSSSRVLRRNILRSERRGGGCCLNLERVPGRAEGSKLAGGEEVLFVLTRGDESTAREEICILTKDDTVSARRGGTARRREQARCFSQSGGGRANKKARGWAAGQRNLVLVDCHGK